MRYIDSGDAYMYDSVMPGPRLTRQNYRRAWNRKTTQCGYSRGHDTRTSDSGKYRSGRAVLFRPAEIENGRRRKNYENKIKSRD